eukprot:TCONS_00045877-protein
MSETFDVYVGNLIPSDSEDDLKEVFDIIGDIHSVKILPLKAGETRNCGFVRFKTQEDAQCAVQYCNNHQLQDGRKIFVRYNGNKERVKKVITEQQPSDEKKETYVITPKRSVSPKIVSTEALKKETVCVSHVESPIKFYCQCVSQEKVNELVELGEELETLCPSQPKVIGQLSIQQIYGCKFSEDEQWYRCSIIRCLQQNQVEIRYIDYGNKEIVDRFGLVTLPANITKRPVLSRCCQIDSVQLVSTDDTSTLFKVGIDKLKELIYDKAIEIEIKKTDNVLSYIKSVSINGSTLDLENVLVSTGSTKVKTFDGFSSPPHSQRTPFAEYKDNALSSGVVTVTGKTTTPTQTKPPYDYELQSYTLKSKLQQKEQALAQLEKATTATIEELRKNLRYQKEMMKNPFSACMKEMATKVKGLRELRANSKTAEDTKLIEVIDEIMESDSLIALSSMKEYNDVQIEQENLKIQQEQIIKCTDKDDLNDLLEERDGLFRKCIKRIRAFLKHLEGLPLRQREAKVLYAVKYIENNFPDHFDGSSTQEGEISLSRALTDYKDQQSNLSKDLNVCRERTNNKSSQLFKAIGQVQRVLHCTLTLNATPADDEMETEKYISEYKNAIEEEQRITMESSKDTQSSVKLKVLITSFRRALSTELEDIQILRKPDFKEKYQTLLDTFKENLKNKPDKSELLKAKKHIKQLKSKFRHKQADLSDLEEDSDDVDDSEVDEIEKELGNIRQDLHKQFIIEHREMVKLADACEGNFPEINKLHPELALDEFIESNNLWQRSRTIDHYLGSNSKTLKSKPKQIAYQCDFNGKPCVIKELSLSSKDSQQLKMIVDRIVEFSKDQRMNTTRVHCIFTDKSERKLYYHQDYATEGNMLEFIEKSNPEPKVLKGLFKDCFASLVSTAKPHCGIKPENVLVTKYNEDGPYRALFAESNFLIKKDKTAVQSLNLDDVENYPKLDVFINLSQSRIDLVCLAALMFKAFHRDCSFTDVIHCDVENFVKDESLKEILSRVFNPSDTVLTAQDILTSKFFEEKMEVVESQLSSPDDVTQDGTADVSKIVNLDDTTISVTDLTDDISNLLNLDESSISATEEDLETKSEGDVTLDQSTESIEDGKEIVAWEKALKERKLSRKPKDEKSVAVQPQEAAISDDDDF